MESQIDPIHNVLLWMMDKKLKKRGEEGGERGVEEMEKVYPETLIYSTFKILILLKTSLINLPR